MSQQQLISSSLAAAGASSVGGLLVNLLAPITTDTNDGGTNVDFDTDPNFYYDWTVPSGVSEISAVAIGGGGGGSGSTSSVDEAGAGGGALSYSNNIAVTPSETLRIYVGRGGKRLTTGSGGRNGHPSGIVRLSDSTVLLKAVGGLLSTASPGGGGQASDGVGDVKFSGSAGAPGNGDSGGGGGGAAGYSADGNTESGGSARWGGTGAGTTYGLGGGGVDVFGEGASGTALGSGGSGGGNGSTTANAGGPGGRYGGGGGGAPDVPDSGPLNGVDLFGGPGHGGAVRIIWGEGRAFPSTLTSFEDSKGNETTVQRT